MKKLDIKSGDKFGKLTVIKEVEPYYVCNKPRRKFKCICECGNTKDILLYCLTSGHTTSCGCEQKRKASISNYKHGLSDKHPLYEVWKNMKNRCNNPNATEYSSYGGRGITICEDWSKNFISFYNWSMLNGWSPTLSIDRIDNNGNYCPENCRWTTSYIQRNNTTKNHYLDYNNRTYTLATLSDYLKIPYNVVRYRISRCNWSVEQLIQYWNDRN